MHTEFRQAIIPDEIRSLVAFDHKAFEKYPDDWFSAKEWRTLDAWWMLVDGRKIGCCAFEPHVDFQPDRREDEENPPLQGSLYIATTGILPKFQNQGFGGLMKRWQII